MDLGADVTAHPSLFDPELAGLSLGISGEGGSIDHAFVSPDRILFVANSRAAVSSVLVDCSE